MAHSILGDEEERNNLFNFGVGKFLHDYPGRVVDEVTAALNQIGTERQATTLPGPGTLRLATAPFAPAFQTLYRQSGNVLAPFINRLSQPSAQAFIDLQNQFAEQQGLPQREYEPLTGEQLAAPIAAAGSLLRGKFPTWFSPARRAVTTAPQQKGDLNYWLGRFKQEKGATSEAKQLGLVSTQGEATESLLSAAPGTLTKEEALSLIEPIELEETVLNVSEVPQLAIHPQDAKEFFGIIDEDWDRMTLHQQLSYIDEIKEGGPHIRRQDDTKYANDPTLNLPGGRNPREILIQLPERESVVDQYLITHDAGRNYPSPVQTEEGALAEAARVGGRVIAKLDTSAPYNNYTGGHWQQPNILVSLRLNDRIVDGKKALHIEEIQSDWHQAGQQDGYRDLAKIDRLKAERASILEEADSGDWTRDVVSKALANVDSELSSALGTVPDAPYKKTWHELGWKRAFIEALRDPSVEILTWTTGDVQADRYDLSKYVEEIAVRREPKSVPWDGTNYYTLDVQYKGNRPGFHTDDPIPENELSGIVGKEMAEKIIGRAEEAPSDRQDYTGLDLKVGGEFHKQLYDQKISQFAKRFLKQFGIGPQTTQLNQSDPPYVVWAGGPEGGPVMPVSSIAEGQAYIESQYEYDESREDEPEYLEVIEAHAPKLLYIRITPEMRETYAEGVPLAMREDEEGLLGRYA